MGDEPTAPESPPDDAPPEAPADERPQAAPPPGFRRVTLLCPDEACAHEQSFDLPDAAAASAACCRACERPIGLDWSHVEPSGELARCLVCGCRDLYKQRDFNRPLGLAVVAIAILFARAPYYWSLWIAAGIDAVIFALRPEVVVCYRCRSVYRGFPAGERVEPYELERAAMYTKYVG